MFTNLRFCHDFKNLLCFNGFYFILFFALSDEISLIFLNMGFS
jgi:hypothetical protein